MKSGVYLLEDKASGKKLIVLAPSEEAAKQRAAQSRGPFWYQSATCTLLGKTEHYTYSILEMTDE